MIRFGFILAIVAGTGLASAASPDPKSLAVSPAEQERAEQLVRRLGGADYKDREAAQAELAKMGRLARPALADAAAVDPSPEVRSRAARLLPRAEADELKARIDTFLADTDLKYDHDLPGWDEFRLAAGAEWRVFGNILWSDRAAERAAKPAYLEMLELNANRSLVVAVGGAPSDLGQLVGARKFELYNGRFPRTAVAVSRAPTAVDVLTLLFAESQVSGRFVPATRTVSVSILLSSPGVNTAFSEVSPRGDVYRSVAANWIDSRDDSVSQYQAMTVATNLNLPGPGARAAARLLADPRALVTYRAQAVVTIVRLDAREQLPALERMMADDTPLLGRVVINGVAAEPMQIRDVALAGAVVLTGQRPEDYGFVSRYAGTAIRFTSYTQWQLAADKRAEAFEKWSQWREANPDQ